MSIYSLKEQPDDDPTLDDPVYQDMVDEIKTLESELKELEQENAWLRFTLEKYNLLDAAEDGYAAA